MSLEVDIYTGESSSSVLKFSCSDSGNTSTLTTQDDVKTSEPCLDINLDTVPSYKPTEAVLDISKLKPACLNINLKIVENKVEAFTGLSCADVTILDVKDGYHGATSITDALDIPVPLFFNGRAFHGATASADDLVVPPIVLFDGDAYHGATAETGVFFTVKFVNPEINYHGAESDSTLQTTQLFYSQQYHGAESNTDLTRSPPIDLETVNNYFGQTLEVDTISTISILSPDDNYHGAETTGDLSTIQSLSFPIAYHGATLEAEFTPNPPDKFIVDHYHGATADLTLNVEQNIRDADAYHGSESETSTISTNDNLGATAYHGLQANINLTTVESESMAADAYHGHDSSFSGEGFLQTHTFNANAYHGATVRAGYDFNFCFDDEITDTNIEFQDFGHRFYNLCNYDHVLFETDLSTNRNLYGNAYHGASSKVGLEPVLLNPETIVESTSFSVSPEAFLWIRFCSGYLKPTGDNVGFDYTTPLVRECSSINGYHGATFESSLSRLTRFINDQYHGATAEINLFVPEPTDAIISPEPQEHGSIVESSLSTSVLLPSDSYHGATLDNIFEKFETVAYHGATTSSTMVSGGVFIEWLTPENEDLENIENETGLCVEFAPYTHLLDYQCVIDDQIILAPKVFFGQFTDISLTTDEKATFSVDLYHGATMESDRDLSLGIVENYHGARSGTIGTLEV